MSTSNYNRFLKVITNNQDIVAERIRWILVGNYSADSYELAKRMITDPCMDVSNVNVYLISLIGSLEWECSNYYVKKAYNTLTDEGKKRLNDKVSKVVCDYVEKMK